MHYRHSRATKWSEVTFCCAELCVNRSHACRSHAYRPISHAWLTIIGRSPCYFTSFSTRNERSNCKSGLWNVVVIFFSNSWASLWVICRNLGTSSSTFGIRRNIFGRLRHESSEFFGNEGSLAECKKSHAFGGLQNCFNCIICIVSTVTASKSVTVLVGSVFTFGLSSSTAIMHMRFYTSGTLWSQSVSLNLLRQIRVQNFALVCPSTPMRVVF